MRNPVANFSFIKRTKPLRLVDIIVFAIILATLVSLIRGYSYGTGDHIEQLPQIYRLLDPSYCPDDFFVNATADFGPRMYYSKFIAFLGSLLPLPIVFLALTWIANFGLVLVTYFAAKDLFEGSDIVAMIACALVMGMTGVTPGGNGDLPLLLLTPSGIAYPLALFSIWAGIRGRAILCAVLASIASVIHPLVGIEAGFIGLLTAAVSLVLFPREGDHPGGKPLRDILGVIIGACILGAATFTLWMRGYYTPVDDGQFIAVLAYFRHPHHYIPSTWRITKWIGVVCQLIAFGFSWKWWLNDLASKYKAYRALIPIIIILLLWLGGYVFVELIPSRLWVTAQTFRLAFILNWLAFLLFARTIVYLFTREGASAKFPGLLILLGSGTAQPVLAFLGHIAEFIRHRMKNISKSIEIGLLMLFLLAAALLLYRYGNILHSLAVLAFMITTAWFLLSPLRWYRGAVPLLVVCAILGSIAIVRNYTAMTPYPMNLAGEVAQYALEATPNDAIFLTPPRFGEFRLDARRAIVVDFKACPFRDEALGNWMTRIEDCYGEFSKTGLPATDEMAENYRGISADRILILQSKYGASYAVLFADTPSDFPTLFENDEYKVVGITPGIQP